MISHKKITEKYYLRWQPIPIGMETFRGACEIFETIGI